MERIETASIALVVVIYLFVAAGIIFAVVCLTFNYYFRNKKYIIILFNCMTGFMIKHRFIQYGGNVISV